MNHHLISQANKREQQTQHYTQLIQQVAGNPRWERFTNKTPQERERWLYFAFHYFTNMRTLKFKSRLHNCVFSLPSIIITITSNEPWNTQTHEMDRNPPITNHKPWPLVKVCFLRGPLRWLTAAKNAIVKAAFELQNSHVCEKRSKFSASNGTQRRQTLSTRDRGYTATTNM